MQYTGWTDSGRRRVILLLHAPPPFTVTLSSTYTDTHTHSVSQFITCYLLADSISELWHSLSYSFNLQTGFRQACISSSALFNIVLDYILRQLKWRIDSECRKIPDNGLMWNMQMTQPLWQNAWIGYWSLQVF